MADNDIIDDELDPCPDDEVLRHYVAGRLKPSWVERAIKSHVALCASCKGRIKEMDQDEFIKRAAERLLERQAKSLAAQREPVSGSVWRTVPENDDELYGPLVVVLEVEENRVQVAEVSEDIGQALDSDMILDKAKSGLSFRCMVRSGNLFFMKAGKLKGYAGTLPDEIAVRVREFCLHYEEFKNKVKLSQCKFGRDREGVSLMMREGIISGLPPASEDDHRVKFLAESRSRIAYLEDVLSPTEEEVRPREVPTPPSIHISVAKSKPRSRYVLFGSIAAGLLALVVTTAGLRQLLTHEETRVIVAESVREKQEAEEPKKASETDRRGVAASEGGPAREPDDEVNYARRTRKPESREAKMYQTDKAQMGRPLPSVGQGKQSEERREEERTSTTYEQALERRAAEERAEESIMLEKRGSGNFRHIRRVAKDLAVDFGDETKADLLSKAIIARDVVSVRKLLDENGGLINYHTTTPDSASPLGLASEKGHYEVVKLLIERGAKIDAVDRLEWTPLMSAAHGGHAEIVKLLLSKGADRSLKNVSGLTALDLALETGNKVVIDLLRTQ